MRKIDLTRCGLLAVCLLFGCRTDLPPNMPELSPTTAIAHIIPASPLPTATAVLNNTAVATPTWPRYAATYYSFAHPADGMIDEQNAGQYLRLQQGAHKLELAYLGAEITVEDDLLTWYDEYTRAGTGEVPQRIIIESTVVNSPDGAPHRRLHEQHAFGDRVTQTILLTHGNLVLSLNAYTDDQAITTLLKAIADSLEFYPDAPKNLAELFLKSTPTP